MIWFVSYTDSLNTGKARRSACATLAIPNTLARTNTQQTIFFIKNVHPSLNYVFIPVISSPLTEVYNSL